METSIQVTSIVAAAAPVAWQFLVSTPAQPVPPAAGAIRVKLCTAVAFAATKGTRPTLRGRPKRNRNVRVRIEISPYVRQRMTHSKHMVVRHLFRWRRGRFDESGNGPRVCGVLPPTTLHWARHVSSPRVRIVQE